MKRTATKWLNALKAHGSNCRCPERTKLTLSKVIKELEIETHEQSTLLAMLASPDRENHVVLISILQQKAAHIFMCEPIGKEILLKYHNGRIYNV